MVVAIAALTIGMVSVDNVYAIDLLSNIQSAEISIEEAAAIAITHLNTESSNLVEIGIEIEDEMFIYDLEFEIENQEVSIVIDPHTGEILEVEQEDLEEDDDDEEEDDDEEDDDED